MGEEPEVQPSLMRKVCKNFRHFYDLGTGRAWCATQHAVSFPEDTTISIKTNACGKHRVLCRLSTTTRRRIWTSDASK